MTNLPNHMRDLAKQRSFSLYEDQYRKLEKIASEKSNKGIISDIVRRGVDLAIEEYYRLLKETDLHE